MVLGAAVVVVAGFEGVGGEGGGPGEEGDIVLAAPFVDCGEESDAAGGGRGVGHEGLGPDGGWAGG